MLVSRNAEGIHGQRKVGNPCSDGRHSFKVHLTRCDWIRQGVGEHFNARLTSGNLNFA